MSTIGLIPKWFIHRILLFVRRTKMASLDDYARCGAKGTVVINYMKESWKKNPWSPNTVSMIIDNLIAKKEVLDALELCDIAVSKYPNNIELKIINLLTQRKAGIFSSENINLLLDYQNNFLSKSTYLYPIFQYLWDYNGMTMQLRDQIGLLLKIKSSLSINQILQICSCLSEMGEYKLARNIVNETKFP